jgi:hypothetical protein
MTEETTPENPSVDKDSQQAGLIPQGWGPEMDREDYRL